MNKESIEQRKVELKQQLDQALANANALHGAIQECDFWLEQLELKEAEDDR